MLRKILPAILFAVSGTLSAASPGAGPYAVLQSYALGGPGGWDYLTLDAPTQRLFIARDDRIMVVDALSGRLDGQIEGMQHVHGVALDPATHRAYASNGAGNSVGVIDLATLRLLATIPVSGTNPDAIVYDPASGHVLTMNGHSASASVIDTGTQREVASIPLPGKPEFAVADGEGHVYANIEDKAELVAIDTRTNQVQHTWSLAPCESPSGLAYDAKSRRLYSVCENHWMIVTAADDGHQVAKLPIGGGPDAVRFDPATRMVYSSNGEGSLTLVHEDDPDHYRVVANVPTQVGARTMEFDSRTQRVYLVAADKAPRGTPVQGFRLLVVGKK